MRKVYPDFDDSAWFASRLKGRGTLRNVATHRHLPTVVLDTTVEGIRDFMSHEMNDDDDDPRCLALSTRTNGMFEGMVHGLLKEGIIHDDFAAECQVYVGEARVPQTM